ncbi:MAG TPA: hypothetical protein VEU73_11345 [Gemmatimonadales bacterium]|nr:hypothetical protein [Gemmatimonadales bacterium]
MRTLAVGFGIVALTVGLVAQVAGQGLVFDARRIAMGGLTLGRSGELVRYNAAYRAVPAGADRRGQPKLTIPIPLGIIQFLHDHPNLSSDPEFKPGSPGFNPVLAVNTILNLPLYYEVKKAPTPTNDVFFGIGKDSFQVKLGASAALVPQDQFGISGSSRPLDPGVEIKGVRVSVMGWLHDDVELQLDDKVLGLLADSQLAQHNTSYNVLVHGIVQGGFAPSIGYAGRVVGDGATGLYVGGALHYYLGVAYFRTDGAGGDSIGNPITANPLNPVAKTFSQYSKAGNALGHGVGGDIGFAWVSGPIEVGVGVNDIGATITWPDTRTDTAFYNGSGFSKPGLTHIETTTKLPVSYVANVGYTVGNTALGLDVLNTGRGATIHIGGEQRISIWALRGGVARDQRKRVEFGWGGGVRLGPVGLDVGFWTHTNALSNDRAITMATSLSIY